MPSRRLRDYRRIRVPAGALPAAALIATDGPPGTAPRHRRFTAIRAAAWGISGQEPKGAIITAGTTSRTAHLLAVMKKGDDLHPGPPGHCRGSVTRGALAAAAVALAGCRRGSRNLRDASAPRQATSSARGHSATERLAKEADMIVRRPLPGPRRGPR